MLLIYSVPGGTAVLIKTGNLPVADSDLPEVRQNSGVPYDAISAEQCSHLILGHNNGFVHAVCFCPFEHRS